MLQLVAPFFLLAINISISQTAEAFFFLPAGGFSENFNYPDSELQQCSLKETKVWTQRGPSSM